MKKQLFLSLSLLLGLSVSGVQASVWQTIKEKVLTKKVMVPAAKIAGGSLLIAAAVGVVFKGKFKIHDGLSEKYSLWNVFDKGLINHDTTRLGEKMNTVSLGEKMTRGQILKHPKVLGNGFAVLAALAGGGYLIVDGILDAVKAARA
jgi:hypothetical protein